MAGKTSPMLKQIEAKYQTFYAQLFQAKLNMAMQMVQDAACFAAHDVLKMGPGRAVDFCVAVREYTNEMVHLMRDDQDDDEEYFYTRAKIDDRLKRIVGAENFLPWEERYSK